MTNLERVLHMQARVSNCLRPSLDPATLELVDSILEALGEPTIGEDRIEQFEVGSAWVEIQTSHTLRGCAQTSEMRFHISLLDSNDPVMAARKHCLRQKLSMERLIAERHLSNYNLSKQKISEFTSELQKLEDES